MATILHNYFRSSTSTRVRAALNLKGIAFDYVPYHLRKGEQRGEAYLKVNPQGLVPALELADGTVLTQSIAIMEYLEEVEPEPALLPGSSLDRARVRALAAMIACEIHPVNNLRVLGRLKSQFGATDAQAAEWFHHWVAETFVPLETMLADDPRTGLFCHGDTPGMADLCIYAQVLNNKRFEVDMGPYPVIRRIFQACDAVPEIAAAQPARQLDAE